MTLDEVAATLDPNDPEHAHRLGLVAQVQELSRRGAQLLDDAQRLNGEGKIFSACLLIIEHDKVLVQIATITAQVARFNSSLRTSTETVQ